MKHFLTLRPLCCNIVAALLLLLASCDAPLTPASDASDPSLRPLRITFVRRAVQGQDYDLSPFTRAAQPIGDACTRLGVAVFRGDEKVKNITQTASDADFGTVSLLLPEGSYQVVAVAHSADGSATITSPSKVTFPGNRVTDTFAACLDVELDAEGGEAECELDRMVAMLRFTDAGTLPDGTAQLRFYYIGGSSTLSPADGCGVVQSKQTEVRAVPAATYDLYTFPHTPSGDQLTRCTVSALAADGTVLAEQTLSDIAFRTGAITTYTAPLFGSGTSSTNATFTFTADAGWEEY